MERRLVRLVMLWALTLTVPPLVFAAGEGEGFAVPMEVKAFVLWLPAMLLGIGFHEWAHAYTAWRLGDSTPEEDERLSLNPLDHLDPLGTVLIVMGQITHAPLLGWGKPVMVNRSAFRNPIRDMMKVAIAGPMMNLLIVAVTLILWHVTLQAAVWADDSGGVVIPNIRIMLWSMLATNVSLAVFNMIPIPPLDGSKVLENYVSADTVMLMRQIEPMGFMILLMLCQTRVLSYPFEFVWGGVSYLLQSFVLAAMFLGTVLVCWWLMVRSLPRFIMR